MQIKERDIEMRQFLVIALMLAGLIMTSCKKEEPAPVEPETEYIAVKWVGYVKKWDHRHYSLRMKDVPQEIVYEGWGQDKDKDKLDECTIEVTALEVTGKNYYARYKTGGKNWYVVNTALRYIE